MADPMDVGHEPLIVNGTFYAPNVRETLTVRGVAVLGKSAVELRAIGYTADMAEEDGWIIDRHCYPWVAYVGARFDTDAFLFLKTEEDDSGA